MVYLVLTIFNT